MKKKVIYIISDIGKALAFEWISSYINKDKIDLSFVLLNNGDSFLENYFLEKGIKYKKIPHSHKYIKPISELYKYLKAEKPDIIHCHLRVAEKVGLTAAFLAGVRNRVYTRHSSTYNHLYHRKGVYVDHVTNTLATNIVAISDNVRNILMQMEGVSEKKIRLIHHGFDFDMFNNVSESEIEKVRKVHNIPTDKLIVGIIARYTRWKGYEYSIPAVGELMKKYPGKLHLLISNANGNHLEKEIIKNTIAQNIPASDVTEIAFENNLAALYKLLHIYIHVPFDSTVEAFGQTYVEALISGVPSVFTMSGIAPEFIVDKHNALVVPFKNTEKIVEACEQLLNSKELREKLIENGKKSVDMFTIKKYIEQLEDFYTSMK